MADIDAVKTMGEIRAANSKLSGEERKAFKKLDHGIKRLAGRIFREAAIRSMSPEDIISSVYVTGLYHGAEIERQRGGI